MKIISITVDETQKISFEQFLIQFMQRIFKVFIKIHITNLKKGFLKRDAPEKELKSLNFPCIKIA